ncbi:MAG TPA: efflux RND transporter permease subunit [Alphaproteobacteria bacterium]|jgi:HAE1 family hydrophobic/amphiphilic exporter-1
MNLPELCIRRPIMTTLVMAGVLLAGAIGYVSLPVSELPKVDFPTINVSASLPGASPETMASAVATPLESQFSSIDGVASMTSSSSLGSTRITLQFDLSKNIDSAAQDVQSAISATLRKLPDDMPNPPSYRKSNPADAPILFLALSSETLPLSKVDDYAETILAQRISTVLGVAEVQVFGAQKYAVRVQADPNALAARDIAFDELIDAVKASNVNQATGSLNGTDRTTTITVGGQMKDAKAFREQTIVYRDGAPVKLGDVSTVLDSVENDKVGGWYNDKRAIILAINRQPGSNTVEVVDSIKKLLPNFEATLPASVKLNILYDHSQSIRASIADVQFTLLLAAALVVMIIFVFLRKLSATIIPSLALPISVVGTFGVMSMLGYSLDNLSLMALTLSVGFVVDDAIVMLENIVRHVENGQKPWEAALTGSREIGFTIISMTASLTAVFIPVVFMGGVVGRLLHEFAVTIVAAIFVSGFVSLTLTPMLCSRFIRGHKPGEEEHHNKLYLWMENLFDAARDGYGRTLDWALGRQRFMLAVFASTLVVTVVLFQVIQKDFLPSEDTGRISVQTEGEPDSSYETMARNQQAMARILQADPNIAGVMSSVGTGGARGGTGSGTMLLTLKPRGERDLSADEIIRELRRKTEGLPGVRIYMQNPPAIRIGGRQTKAQYQYTLQGSDLPTLMEWAPKMQAALGKIDGLRDVSSDLDRAVSNLSISIDRDRAAALGVGVDQIESVLGSAFGTQQISTIYTQTNQYEVILGVAPEYQGDPTALSRLYLRSKDGGLVPLDTVVTATRGVGPLTINHLGQLPSVTLSFDVAPGISLGTAVDLIHQAEVQMHLPDTISGVFEGTAQAFESSLQGMGMLLILAVAVVYIVLGILYESYIHPLTILSGLPSAGIGALFTLWIFGVPLSLYAFVGIIMLVGIVKKNAIMMIDFALERQRGEGLAPRDAIREAALTRFRPIMMTTMAALVGSLPIAIGMGAGGEARQPLGLAVVGGLILSQVLTLYLTPVIYIRLDRLSGWRPFGKHRAEPVPVPGE